MKKCHVCMTECGDNAEVCPICGAFLTEDDIVNEEQEEQLVIDNPVLLATFDDVVAAEIFKDILKDNGIPCTSDKPDGEASLRVVFGAGFAADDVYVDESDFEKAESLYKEFSENPPEAETVFDDSFESEEEI